MCPVKIVLFPKILKYVFYCVIACVLLLFYGMMLEEPRTDTMEGTVKDFNPVISRDNLQVQLYRHILQGLVR